MIKNKEFLPDNIFDRLYELKKLYLMCENLYGEGFTPTFLVNTYQDFQLPLLSDYIEFAIKAYKSFIPKSVFEEWDNSDYEVYTDKYHHRKFFNEIPNGDFIDTLLEYISNALGVPENENFSLMLYDFEPFELYFEDEESLNNFEETFNCYPCTAFRVHGKYNEELWSA